MKKYFIWCLLTAFCLLAGSIKVYALDRGPIIANNILGGSCAGAVVGMAAGTFAYGMDNNYNPELLVNGAVYGFITGAVLGTGIGIYEIVSERGDTGFTVADYTIGGTGIGAFLGVVVATIPYMRDGDPEDFTIGLGLGGIIGATFGLGFAALDISARNASGGNDDLLLSGKVGIYPDPDGLMKYVTETKREPVLCCRLMKLSF